MSVAFVRRSIGIGLLLFAVLQLGYRGMQRARHEMPLWDYASVYCASRAWLHGHNPYDLPTIENVWRAGDAFASRDVSYWVPVYPPTSLAMLVPFALLPSSASMIGWALLTLVLIGVQVVALADLAKIPRRDPRFLILAGAALASAPLQFGILSGQLSLPAISLCVIAFWCVARDRAKLAGVLIGLACAIKPQVAAPFALYYLIRRPRDVGFSAALAGAFVGAVSLAVMQWTNPAWLADWVRNVGASTELGGVNDYGWTGPFRDEIVDLKMLLVSLIRDPLALKLSIVLIFVALFVWYLRAFERTNDDRRELLALAGLSALALIPIYHRVYDATLLTAALAWALAELDGRWRRHALAMLACMAVFLVPFDFVRSFGYRVPGINAVAETPWWQTLVAPHYAWGLLAITIALLATMTAQATPRPVAVPQVEPVLAGAGDEDDDEDVIIAR